MRNSVGAAVVIGAMVGMVCQEAARGADWYGSRCWTHRQRITISSSLPADGDLSDFPVLIKLTDSGNTVFTEAQANGGDILFTTADGQTKIPHELETFDATGKELWAWVSVPTLSSSSNTELYMYYGHPGVYDQSDAPGVWSNHYWGVWHLAQSPGDSEPQVIDSTGRGHDGIASNMVPGDLVSDKVDGALDFDGVDDNVDLDFTATSERPLFDNGATISAWCTLRTQSFAENSDQLERGEAVFCTGTGYSFTMLQIGHHYDGGWMNNRLKLVMRSGGSATAQYVYSGTELSTGVRYHVAGVADAGGSTVKLFINGAQDASVALTGSRGTFFTSAIGRNFVGALGSANDYFDGIIDEVRVSTNALSSNWVSTCYSTMNTPDSYLTFGGAEGVPALAAEWYDTSWGARQPITIWHAVAAGAGLTNFPLMVTIGDADNPLFAEAQADGADILFTADDGVTKLAHEIESYSASGTTQLVAWVNVTNISATTDTTLFLYYGNSAATDQSDVTGVWNSDYRGVWHLSEDPSGNTPQMLDSLGANDGTATNMATGNQVAGTVDGSLDFDGVDEKVFLPDMGDNWTNITLSAWVKPESFWVYAAGNVGGKGIVGAGNGAWGYYRLTIGGTSSSYDKSLVLYVRIGGSSGITYATPADTLEAGTWYHVASVDDGNTVRLFINGQMLESGASYSDSGWGLSYYGIAHTIGNQNVEYFDGGIDEVRIDDVARPDNWITASYRNQGQPGVYVCLGDPTSYVPTGAVISIR